MYLKYCTYFCFLKILTLLNLVCYRNKCLEKWGGGGDLVSLSGYASSILKDIYTLQNKTSYNHMHKQRHSLTAGKKKRKKS